MKKRLLLPLIAILLLIIATILLINNHKQAAFRASTTLDNFMNGGAKPGMIDYTPLGKYGPLVKELGTVYLQAFDDLKELDAKFSQPEFKQLLDKTYLQNPNLGKSNLLATAESLKPYKTRFQQDSAKFTSALVNSNLTAQEQAQITANAQHNMEQLIKKSTDLLNLSDQILDKAGAIYDFLLSKQGKYTVQGTQVLFYAQQDADSYNTLLQNLQSVLNTN